MINDLISREALKKLAIPCEIHNGALTDMCVPLYQIDNAPAVEEISVIEFKEPLPLVKAQKIVKTLSKDRKGDIL